MKVTGSNPVKGQVPSLLLGVVAIKKGTFGLPSTAVAKLTYLFRSFILNVLMSVIHERWLRVCSEIIDTLENI